MSRRLSPTSILLLIGSIFFLFEAVLHAFGLSILEHDKIFLFTHDRYIALYALTMAAIMALTASDLHRYRPLFFLIMGSILLGIVNAMVIERLGGYDVLFPAAATVDGQLSGLGVGVVVWYIATWIAFLKGSTSRTHS